MVTTLVTIPGYQVNEQLYNGSRTLVYRGYRETDSLRVVIKLLKNPYPGFSELVQFRNQYTIAKNLNSPLIIQTYSLEPYQNGYVLVMEDFGGISLKKWGTRSSLRNLTEFLQIAIALCNILDILYHERIIHKDIKPANILINPETKQIKLIDFSIASLLPREIQTLISPNVLEGTLAYISPEQTGRMNQGIDYRTDFYSLGVTFYELLTKELPFKSKDMMELVHCHIAKLPAPLEAFKIPKSISDIVMKLMAKNPEDRYQSALGLKYDLENCLIQLQSTGKIESFPIAQTDVCDRFIIPDKLYGRQTEVEILLQAFERVSLGATEMILVAGFSGIGKTAVVNEVHKPIVRQRGYFIKGKYDQFQRNIPFSGFVQAFRDLMGQLLTESDTQIQEWKSKLLKAVGENGQVIIEVIPELKRIIGIQPPAPELSGTAAQNRFNLLFQKFTQVFTIAEHPLVIFLDDLQWADSASLKLMQLLMTDTGHLLIIGAYRDHEVNPVHPLMLTLNEIEKALFTINTITLAPLSQVQINYLVADTLKCSENLALPLSLLVSQKTQGNPFFATQFLKALHQDELIEFSFESGCWECDITRVTQQAVTDDVVAFMAFQLRRLPSSTQNVLQLAACIGNQFDLETLTIVSEKSEIEIAACLWKALQEGLILPTDDIYKFYVGQESQAVTQEISQTVKYKFLHDRVQQAAYSLIPEKQKKATHLQIGKLLLQNTLDIKEEDKTFEIVNQLNIALILIVDPIERKQLVKLNLKAGTKAKLATAYTLAVEYLTIGLQLLPYECWHSQYELTLVLYQSITEVLRLSGDFERMESYATVVLQQAKTLLEQIPIYNVKIQAYMAQAQHKKALQIAVTVLQSIGVELPQQVNQTDIECELEQTKRLLADKAATDLLELPKMTDVTILAAMQILSSIMSAAYQAAPALFRVIVFKQVQLSILYGNAPESTYAYASYGLILCGVLGEIDTGYEFGEMALLLLNHLNAFKLKSKTLFAVNCFIRHWKSPVKETLNPLLQAYTSGLETGDIEYAVMSAYVFGRYAYLSGHGLHELAQAMGNYGTIMHQLKQTTYLNFNSIYYQSVLNLLGMADNPCFLIGEIYDEVTMLPLHHAGNQISIICQLHFCKLLLCYLFGKYKEARENAGIVEQYLTSVTGLVLIPTFYFYESLTNLALYKDCSMVEQKLIIERVTETNKKLKQCAQNAPKNYAHKSNLVEAESFRISGQKTEAIELYDRAISLAKENGYIQEEGLSNELAAKFYLDWGKEKVAQVYMQEAYYCYARWGAKAKTNDLEQRYPQLLQPILQQQRINLNPLETIAFRGTFSSTDTSSTSSTNISNVLDFTSVLKASQAISSSLEIDQLITSLTRIILENSGAKKSALILPQGEDTAVRGFPPLKQVSGDTWQVKAITFINHGSNSHIEIQTILNSQLLDTCEDIPTTIINYVKNTQQTVVIDNLQTDIPGVIGEYMYRTKPQSVLCTPIINQGHLVGIIYLENKLTPGVFTSDRLSVINLLCTQAAISLENAQLYTDLQGSQARFHHLAENAPGMIYQFQLSPDGISRFNYVSTGCHEIYEIPPEQVVADASSLISAVPPEDMAHYQESVIISAQTLEPWRYEGRIITPSGKVKWIQAVSRPIKQADGTIIWDGLLLDVTERKQAEAAVFQKSQELKEALEELQQAQLQIVQSEKMSALGNLVAGVAHEMNNPLGFIYASLQQAKPSLADVIEHLKLYQSSLPNPGDEIIDHAEEIDLNYSLEDLPKMIDSMVMACDRLKNISTSLRTFSRADKDYKVPFNIHEGIDSTILILKHRLKANEQRPAIEVITDYGKLPQVECFPGQLNQVFMNILANAIDALDESNTERTFEEIKTNPNLITIKTSLENEGVKIAIADNGKGMNESVKQKIFDHLFTTKGVGKGTGLGLAIAKSIVEETHNGKLSFNSVLGEGTEFFIEMKF
ncbi:MAG: AAA family ATPase [Nostoc sp.]|uniref:trifunctional serine/threonine-protein kinase/ATP-binding protein/sensor histidine kinase n=1 Tax=Nostoc sp. TaxID=1180 RepID=UPI002FF7ECCA